MNHIISSQKNCIRQNTSAFNYFTTLASNLSGKENELLNESEILQLLNRVPDSCAFTINCTTYYEVQKIIWNLRNNCSSDHNNVLVKFHKPVVDQIKEIFPDSWKVAGVCLIPKIDNPVTVKDFQPISILPVLSKVYKKVILSQLLNYIKKCTVYNPTQSGFHKGHLTTALVIKFRNDIQKALNWIEITISVLTDYSKAFDTINHKRLLDKLVSLNFSNRMRKIIMSYLTNPHQYMQTDDQTSPKSPVHFGVPQGSILGPVLFNVYVAVLPFIQYVAVLPSDSIQYADDTTIYRTYRPNGILQEIPKLKINIKTVSGWSVENGLVFNDNKVKCITFSSRRKVNDQSYLICFNRDLIAEETTVKLLEL